MRTERLLLIASVGLNLGLAVALYHQRVAHRALAEAFADEGTRHKQLKREHQELLTKPGPASNASADADQLELARLRNEVTRLRNEQRAALAANSAAARRPAAPAPASAPSANPPKAAKLTSNVSAQVTFGHALALGGWPGPEPGQRILSFVTPTTVADAPGQVLLETQLVTLPDRLLDRLGLQNLRTDQADSQSAAGLDSARLAALLRLAEQESGVVILSSPRVITTDGRAAQVAVTQAQPDGSHTGPVINLTPTLEPNGQAVRLDVGVELNLPVPKP